MAAPATEETTLTATGTQGGTVPYAAPEFISNFKRATTASDIYSFGAILHDVFGAGAPRIPYTELSAPGPIGPVMSKCTKRLPARRYQNIAALRAELYAALDSAASIGPSNADAQALALLASERPLTSEEWDVVFARLDDTCESPAAHKQLLNSISLYRINELGAEAPELLSAYGAYYCDYVRSGEGNFDFDFCDVISDRLYEIYKHADVSLKARILLEMAILGASHNRWIVERRFVRLADETLDSAVASRLVAEIEMQGLDFERYLSHIERSIGVSRTALHPLLQAHPC